MLMSHPTKETAVACFCTIPRLVIASSGSRTHLQKSPDFDLTPAESILVTIFSHFVCLRVHTRACTHVFLSRWPFEVLCSDKSNWGSTSHFITHTHTPAHTAVSRQRETAAGNQETSERNQRPGCRQDLLRQ